MIDLSAQDRAIRAIRAERVRQERLKAMGKFHHTAADVDLPCVLKLPILTEEVGEVARALCDGTNLREELVQVAAVALAWVEALEKMEADHG
jgi:NTP pyrophosphatase (non-canonical NTP hydrolase)